MEAYRDQGDEADGVIEGQNMKITAIHSAKIKAITGYG